MTKQAAIEKLNKKANQLLETARAIEAIVPDLPDYVKVWGVDDEIRIDAPLNISYLREIRRAFGDGWKLQHVWDYPENGWRSRIYNHPEYKQRLIVTLDANKPGATCQRILVGVEEKPVYQIVCN